MSELPSPASEARDGTGGTSPDATWFDDEATAGGGVPRRRERPVVVDSTEPGHGRETADRQAGRAANRAGQSEAPTGRATSATSGGRSAHTDTGRAVAVGGPPGSGSLIGDALDSGDPQKFAGASVGILTGLDGLVVVDADVYDPVVAARMHGQCLANGTRAHRGPNRRGQVPRRRCQNGPQSALHRVRADRGWTTARRNR
jgi:hypothetical protein